MILYRKSSFWFYSHLFCTILACLRVQNIVHFTRIYIYKKKGKKTKISMEKELTSTKKRRYMDEARQNSAVFHGSKEQFARVLFLAKHIHLILHFYKNGNNYRASVIVFSVDCVFSSYKIHYRCLKKNYWNRSKIEREQYFCLTLELPRNG